MIKLLFKLAVVALLANAAFHIGSEYLTYFRFRDSIRDAAMFRSRNNAELMARIMELANEYEIPLEQENVNLDRADRHMTIDAWYDKPIEFAPNYPYLWHFSMSLEVDAPLIVPLPGAPPRRY